MVGEYATSVRTSPALSHLSLSLSLSLCVCLSNQQFILPLFLLPPKIIPLTPLMAKLPQFIFWVLSLSLIQPNPLLSQLDEFVYNGFSADSNDNATTNIALNGVAEIKQNGLLMLTCPSPRLIGRAFYPNPIKFKEKEKSLSFSTAFVFNIIPQYGGLGGHGFAFVISPAQDFPQSLPSQYLGLVNQSNNGNLSNHFFAVEFDTVQDYELEDINGNHVGIDVNGLVSIASVDASYFEEGNSTKTELDLKSGKTIQAWIDYNSTKNELNVTLSLSSTKPRIPILSIQSDLSSILEESMYVGFSSSTGLLASYHYIKGWSFKINGEAQSLHLSSLPSLPEQKRKQIAFAISVLASALFFILSATGIALFLIRRTRKKDAIEPWEMDIGPHRFSYKELKQATKGFKDKELLGFGGSGRVYRGVLPNSNTQIAVKRISNESKQGMIAFMSEIATIGRLRHRNLVLLLGWCRKENDLLIVYDFMPNGSLDKYIFDEPRMILSWKQRLKIIKGVASGLHYLHEGWKQSVIHRDIKAGNVLLDSEMNGKLGDFGLAKLYEHGSNPSTTKVVGTLGYLAPELTRTGKPNRGSDVFAFGALILEVVCGRKPVDMKAMPEELFLVEWVWGKWREGNVLDIVDGRLRGEFDTREVVSVIKLGLMCSNSLPWKRPSMREVVGYLEGEVELPNEVAPPDEREV